MSEMLAFLDPKKNFLTFAIICIITLLLLIFGVVILWAYKLMTGVVMALVLLVISWTILSTKAIPTRKYPWAPLLLWLMPVMGFFIGVIGERTGAFYVTPLMEKSQPITPYYAGENIATWIQSNIEAILLMIVLLCLFIMYVASRSK